MMFVKSNKVVLPIVDPNMPLFIPVPLKLKKV